MSTPTPTALSIGSICEAKVTDTLPTGYWLVVEQTRLFLPIENTSSTLLETHTVKVFITRDKDDQVIADTRLPLSPLDQAVLLTAKDATATGAFFNWGTSRDLYVPKKWQESPINPGMDYLVVPMLDEKSNRIVGCTKLKRCFSETNQWLQPKQKVMLQVFAKTQLGYKMLIDGNTIGLLFHSDVHVDLNIGDKVAGSIKAVREDGKIDLSLTPQTRDSRDALQNAILEDLDAHGGLSTLTDKSSPDEIYERFKVSKGAYKKALGSLFKAKRIVIDKQTVRLI